jgi:hypothetical protein
MKFSFLPIWLLSAATFSTLMTTVPIRPATAQCVMNDSNIQVNISGSRQPTKRTNNVSQGSTGGCVGNTINTTNVQSSTGGTDPVTQNRSSNQQLNGSNNSPIGINMAPAKFKQNVQVDVYNPADRLKR